MILDLGAVVEIFGPGARNNMARDEEKNKVG